MESHHQFPHHHPHRRPQCLLRTKLHPTLSGIAVPTSKQGGITPHKQSLLCCVDNHRQPFRAQAPLPIPKLWQSYSVASYIPCPLRGKGLGKRGGALFGKRDGVIRKKSLFNGKEGRGDFRNTYY